MGGNPRLPRRSVSSIMPTKWLESGIIISGRFGTDTLIRGSSIERPVQGFSVMRILRLDRCGVVSVWAKRMGKTLTKEAFFVLLDGFCQHEQ